VYYISNLHSLRRGKPLPQPLTYPCHQWLMHTAIRAGPNGGPKALSETIGIEPPKPRPADGARPPDWSRNLPQYSPDRIAVSRRLRSATIEDIGPFVNLAGRDQWPMREEAATNLAL
jgi:hypothetical protein